MADLLTKRLHMCGDLKADREVHGRTVAGMLECMGFERASPEHGYARFSITKEQFDKVRASLGVVVEEERSLALSIEGK